MIDIQELELEFNAFYGDKENEHTLLARMHPLIAEVKRLRLLFRELINDMSVDEYIEWCNRIGCPDGLEVEAMKQHKVIE